MLVLSRRKDERIKVGKDIVLTVVSIRGGKVRVGIEAPRDVCVLRGELEGGLGGPEREGRAA
jgi:carbon storage regulator